MDEESFKEAIRHAKIPILVLDQKWHRLFAISGKPEEVKKLEVELNELLQLQGKLNNEQRELKKLKNRLMNNIVSNMENAGDDSMETDKRLIDETNEKIKQNEDELLDLPNRIKETDGVLMMATMRFCYAKLRTNAKEASEIADWIKNVRIELKKNIIKKQNREINNKEIYSYMHDIFGKDVLNLFDVADQQELLDTAASVPAPAPSNNAASSDEKKPKENITADLSSKDDD
ncbi:MAG: hypothetical protein IJJ79_06995 [Lachnospiraceae bacterium]|nr:hypothetical protein [Lachnospiraceae bacterium]